MRWYGFTKYSVLLLAANLGAELDTSCCECILEPPLGLLHSENRHTHLSVTLSQLMLTTL